MVGGLVQGLGIRLGGAADAPRLLALFDDAIEWLVARGQTGQWGAEPFSTDPRKVARVDDWAAGGGLWLACPDGDDPAGAIVLGDAHDYVPPADRPELYVQVLLTAAAWRGRGVGARLIEHAAELARDGGARRLRVDCWDGVPELPAQYERLGFKRTGSFAVGEWPGALLELELP
jgi:GNAT superfamily N-acetyltransferase